MISNLTRLLMGGCASAALTAATLTVVTPAAHAEGLDDLKLDITSTVSIGMGIRTSEQDKKLISVRNGGEDTATASENFDDGNLNYNRGDFFSASTRMMHELHLSNENVGAFVRLGYFYDFVMNDASDTRRTTLSEDAKDAGGTGLEIYDAYIYGDFTVGDSPVTLRFGNQVINWGEALFLPGGISQSNAIDVAKVVTPGTNIREAYLPSPMFYANIGVLPGLSVEGYYQLGWRRSDLLPTGTFFSTDDILGPGAEGFFFAGDPGGTGLTAQQLIGLGAGIPKLGDISPRDGGQFGVATRYYMDSLATELSAFYLRYHAKTPYLSATGNFAFTFVPPFFTAGPAGYYAYYPEDIDLYGTSVSFPAGPLSIGIEAAYQPDYPLMMDDALTAATLQAVTNLGPSRINGVTYGDRWNYIANAAVTIGPGLEYIGAIPGYVGADQMDVIVEVGAVDYPGGKPAGVSGDTTAWGGIVSASAIYTNVFGSEFTLKPSISYTLDVNGTAVDRSTAGTPIEGQSGLTVGMTATFRDNLSATVSYTENEGGGLISRNSDRDYVSLTASYSF